MSVALDIPGPGRPTPQEAAAPYADAGRLVLVRQQRKTATLHVVADDGHVFRIFQLT